MKVLNRTAWTATYPKVSVGTEATDGTPNFRNREVQGVSLHSPGLETLFVEREPSCFFRSLEKEDYSLRGYGDIAYNLGVAPNVEGVFVLRGMCNKSVAHSKKELNSTYVSVLVLLGNNEPPTDLLLQNIVQARNLVLSRFPEAKETKSNLNINEFWDINLLNESSQFVNQLPTAFTEETGVHVFELIEALAYWGYYRGRNAGVYDELTRQAVRELQADLSDGNLYMKRVDGQYGRYTREAFGLYLKQLKTNNKVLVNSN